MNYWLFSTEPASYPWQRVEAETRACLPAGKVRWDGIRGGAAQKYMRQIRPRDLILAYHSSPEKSVVGVAEAVSASYPEPGVPEEEKQKWHVIDIAWRRWLAKPSPSPPCAKAKRSPR